PPGGHDGDAPDRPARGPVRTPVAESGLPHPSAPRDPSARRVRPAFARVPGMMMREYKRRERHWSAKPISTFHAPVEANAMGARLSVGLKSPLAIFYALHPQGERQM